MYSKQKTDYLMFSHGSNVYCNVGKMDNKNLKKMTDQSPGVPPNLPDNSQLDG